MSARPAIWFLPLMLACSLPKAATDDGAADVELTDLQNADSVAPSDTQTATDAAADDVPADVFTAPQACIDGGWSAKPFAES